MLIFINSWKSFVCTGITCLNIHTDSEFLINSITKWVKKWKKNNWLTANGEPVKNKEQLILLDDIINSMEAVKWVGISDTVKSNS